MTIVALVDYGSGNLRSVEKALCAVGASVHLASSAAELEMADKIVLPGVGAFGDCMRGLMAAGLVPALRALARERPLLGICVGMQLLFERSSEHGEHAGLGLLPGAVRRFEFAAGAPERVPHTGWNQLQPALESPLLHGLPAGSHAYFNHGYYCDALPADTLAWCEHGLRFSAVVGRAAIYGIQCHPEKSQAVGLQMLRNFVERG